MTAMAAMAAMTAACADAPRDPAEARIVTDDVRRFVAIRSALARDSRPCAGLERYFDSASAGLVAYRNRYHVGPEELCITAYRTPWLYTHVSGKLALFDSATHLLRIRFDRLRALYADARLPAVYVVVGNGSSLGTTTTDGRRPTILIGAELVGSAAELEATIAHELVHAQQDYGWIGKFTEGPAFLRGTLLRHAIKEGAADFLAELITGVPSPHRYNRLALSQERQMWTQFTRDMHDKSYGRWLYADRARRARGGFPNNMGYFFGYRITRAYYENATDKTRAVREILTIRDFDRFLWESGYSGGSPD
jgi:hypothetical protein